MVKHGVLMRPAQILFCGFAAVASAAGIQIRDINGQLLNVFNRSGKVSLLFFISSDCPISNSYAPEIQRLCRAYESSGVSCALLYEDSGIDAAQVRTHLSEYRYNGIPSAIDRDRRVARRTDVSVTPEAVVVDSKGEIRYRGRVDNFYEAFGKSRQQVTEHDLSDAVDAVLAGRPVLKPETKALGCYIVDPDILRK